MAPSCLPAPPQISPAGVTDLNKVPHSHCNSFGGTETLLSSEMGFSGFGLYADATSNLSISLPIACYTLDGMERAIARQAKANSAFWTAVGSHQPHGTQLADPDINAQWNAATNDAALAASGTVYTRIVQLRGEAG